MTAASSFEVDLRGVVDLLSRHLYSSPQVYLRELLQNGRDAVHRRALDAGGPIDPAWQIRICAARGDLPLTVSDDGAGLSLSDVRSLLATVGNSSKRDILGMAESEFLGHFGIGLLSCFMIGDRIRLVSRSASGQQPVEWTGFSNGTYTVRELSGIEADEVAVGTSVEVFARADERGLVEDDVVEVLARRYGEFLSVPIFILQHDRNNQRSRRPPVLVTRPPLWRTKFPPGQPPNDVMDYGTELLGVRPMQAIPLGVMGTDLTGVAFVLPFSPPPGSRLTHRAYLGGMLVSENISELLPEWAFFVRCVVDTTSLSPTASRESFMDDQSLQQIREGLGRALADWLLWMATERPDLLSEFIAVHQLALKALVLHDDVVAKAIVLFLSVNTSSGLMTVADLVAYSNSFYFTETDEDFSQIASITGESDVVVNGGYAYDADLMARLPQILPGVRSRRITLLEKLRTLELPPASDAEAIARFESLTTQHMSDRGVQVTVRQFNPADVPALYVMDERALQAENLDFVTGSAGPLWASLLRGVDDHQPDREYSGAQILCCNYKCDLVRQTLTITNTETLFRVIRLLYVQSLLAGQRVLGVVERRMLISTISELVAAAVDPLQSS